jgi:DNA polymerase-3 subunit alpha
MTQELAHLHVHSEYSLLDGAIEFGELIDRVKELGHKAVALTDHGNLFGAIEFYTKCKSAGLKAIIGCEIFHPGTEPTGFVAKERGHVAPQAGAFHLVVLAKNLAGYKHLIKLVSDGYLKGLGSVPVVPETSLDTLGGDLIALSACQRGEFGYLVAELRSLAPSGAPLPFDVGEDHPAFLVSAALRTHVDAMRARFGDGNYYVELINNNIPAQKKLLPDLVAAARHFGLPLVATADAHYLRRDDAEAHAVLMGIKHGLTMSKIRGRRKDTRFHIFDDAEMQAAYGAWPEALENTGKIATACNVEFKFGEYYLPKFDAGTGETAEAALRRMSAEMLEERFEYLGKLYGAKFDDAKRQSYRERLAYELDVICKMGFPGYFLIVQDFINWAKRQGIPVGPGRGSGAGSLVAYALRITDIDPIPYNLLFERFLNPERVSMPDFDVDFCQDRRDEVIKYVTDKYGYDHVAQITTFGKMNAKAVIRDVGRVLELGFGRVDRIARLIPNDLGITLEDAIKKEPRITEEAAKDDAVAELLRLAKKLEGLSRHSSVHAAGIVMSDGPMTDYVPVYTTETDGLITQYEMKMAEKVGLVKFDFLGLKTLTVIEKAVEIIRRKRPDFDISLIPMDDKAVYKLISDGHSVGMFQLESPGMRALVTKLKPSNFEDIIAVVALFRPGPLGSGMVEDFIERKHGRAQLAYPLPQLEPILKDTYGIILYQEQVMKIAGELASYSLGEADLLRRAMGKKIASEMEKQKARFVSGAVTNGIDEEKAGAVFDLMAEFANYGFNKSHSAAYGVVSYQTAYLKQHFPEEFMAAIMTCDLDNTKKIVRYVDECRRMRLKLLPPDINRSDLAFEVAGPRTLSFGLAAIKGLGAQAVEPLVTERRQNGPFKSLADMARRVNLQKVGKKTLELLAAAGALDTFCMSRAKLTEVIGDVVKFSEEIHTAKGEGQRGLFDMMDDTARAGGDTTTELSWPLSTIDKRPGAGDPEWLKKEKNILGVYLTGHPLQFHREDLRNFGKISIADLPKSLGKKGVSMVAALAAVNERITAKGTRMASLRLEDEHGAVEAVMFQNEMPPVFPDAGTLVVVTGNVDESFDKLSIRFRLDKIEPLEEVRQENVRQAFLKIVPHGGKSALSQEQSAAIQALKRLLDTHKGDTPLHIVLGYGDSDVLVKTNAHVDLGDPFLHGLIHMTFDRTEIRYQLYPSSRSAEQSQ